MKTLIITLVIGMASMANATMQISVNGDKYPPDLMYQIHSPGDSLILDVWTDTQINPIEEHYWALVADASTVSISGGVSLFPTEPYIEIYDDAQGAGFPLPANENGVWGWIFTENGNIPVGSTIFDNILIQLKAITSPAVEVKIYETPDWMQFTLMDSVMIEIYPEPTTVALLGLGGLFLRRRR